MKSVCMFCGREKHPNPEMCAIKTKVANALMDSIDLLPAMAILDRTSFLNEIEKQFDTSMKVAKPRSKK